MWGALQMLLFSVGIVLGSQLMPSNVVDSHPAYLERQSTPSSAGDLTHGMESAVSSHEFEPETESSPRMEDMKSGAAVPVLLFVRTLNPIPRSRERAPLARRFSM